MEACCARDTDLSRGQRRVSRAGVMRVPRPNRTRELYASGAPVADRRLPVFHDHGHLADALRVEEHRLEIDLRLFDVAVVDRIALAGIGLTGRGRVGSSVLAEDHDGATRSGHLSILRGVQRAGCATNADRPAAAPRLSRARRAARSESPGRTRSLARAAGRAAPPSRCPRRSRGARGCGPSRRSSGP